jgi:hypothetical protein
VRAVFYSSPKNNHLRRSIWAIRDDITKGKILKAIFAELGGRSVDKDEFNELLVKHGLLPIPSSPGGLRQKKAKAGVHTPPLILMNCLGRPLPSEITTISLLL